MSKWWAFTIRTIMGAYWIYFSSQKWLDSSWVKAIIRDAGLTNPFPFFASLITNNILPRWAEFTLVITMVEAAVGFALLLGVFTRLSSLLGAAVLGGLAMSFIGLFTEPPIAWFYLFSITGNISVLANDPLEPLGLDRLLVRKWSRLVQLGA